MTFTTIVLSVYPGAKDYVQGPHFACTSSFGMSGANAHMIMAPKKERSKEDNAHASNSHLWRRIEFHPLMKPLRLALHFHYIHQGAIEIYSTPFLSPNIGPLLQATIHGHRVVHASVLMEAAFAASYMMDESRLRTTLGKVRDKMLTVNYVTQLPTCYQ